MYALKIHLSQKPVLLERGYYISSFWPAEITQPRRVLPPPPAGFVGVALTRSAKVRLTPEKQALPVDAEEVFEGFPVATYMRAGMVRRFTWIKPLLPVLKFISPRAVRFAEFIARKLEKYQAANRKG